MKRWKLVLSVLILAAVIAVPVFSEGQQEGDSASDLAGKTEILVGVSSPLTGPLASTRIAAWGPMFKLWVQDVNNRGGIYLSEIDKRLPLKVIEYDDKSDMGTMTRLMEKLIVEDKVDLLMPPCSTAFLFAGAQIASKHGMVLMGGEGGALKIREEIKNGGVPYVFVPLSFADHNNVPPLVDLMKEKGVKTVAVVSLGDLHGVEYREVAIPLLEEAGIEIVIDKTIPPGIKDMSQVIKDAKAQNVDAFLQFAYPGENVLTTKQCIELGYNPKLYLVGPGGSYGWFTQAFGPAGENLMSFGAWNAKISPAHADLEKRTEALVGIENVDYWGHNLYYAGLECLEQAVERAGNLDQDKIKEILENEHFDTVLGDTWFDENHMLAVECHTGEVGQWQNGVYEVVAPADKATADLVYPKKPW